MNRKSYILTGYDIKAQYFFETQVFTNKKVAEGSYDYLTEYLIRNHDLDRNDLVRMQFTNNVKTNTIGRYVVALRIFEIQKKVIAYI